jgi:hypothetical protein
MRARSQIAPVLSIVFFLLCAASLSAERLRVIVETDAGGDPDDEQSLVRFLLYANEWDVEGIIANRAQARAGENRNVERTGLGIVRRMIQAYGDCHANLIQHDPRYPTADTLLSRTVAGYADVEDGVQLIIKAIDSPDPRPVWFMNWGTDAGSAPSCLKRALDQILSERRAGGYAKFKGKIRLASDDQFGDHTFKIDPPFPIWVDTFRPLMNGKRWYHQLSAITAKAGGFDLFRDVINNHGPLGALYPTNTTHWQKEGDSGTFLYLLPVGMNDPDQPGWGSWAGRYGSRDNAAGKPYYWANQLDSWNGATNRDNTLLRWAAHLQNDFRARLDWCVTPFTEANHRPEAILNGTNEGIAIVEAQPGTEVKLTADGSTDPDRDAISYHWVLYPEAGTYRGAVTLKRADTKNATVLLGENVPGDVHMILVVSDQGNPPLAAYRRVILRVPESPRK